ncbi:hypothetical protein jhhlp_005147 [Lomentospora prolificans]|uniref:Heterokaryon incompatibility domain-containing protein n=1 Tax=Lomentospora prolificans TaxID=41688 RepID=A0A2N3N7L9_9PEZI|nr:hypothetical protein jhhlp_005147 [Lomentospora prolificans]
MYNDEMLYEWEWEGSERQGRRTTTLANWLAGIAEPGSQTARVCCKGCVNFDVSNLPGYQTAYTERYALYDHTVSLERLLDTASSGCRRCQVLAQAYFFLSPSDDGDIRLKFLPSSVVMSRPMACLEVLPVDESALGVMGFPRPGKGRRRHASMNTQEPYEVITLAINECIRDHPDCRPPSGQVLPARLVEVPSLDGSPVKVVTTPATSDIEYTALSHCWGKYPLLKLLKHHGSGDVEFEWAELPQSFKDACKVTRYLNQKYVWIDSLCIIQDDPGDWRREAAKMGSIYEGSYVTIAAADAAGSVDGFLHPRYEANNFTVDDSNGNLVRFVARDYDLKMHNFRFFHYGDTPDHEWLMRPVDMDQKYVNPILLRGWCFQERLMAKRILHFKRYEFLLECNMGVRCECSGMIKVRHGTIKSHLNVMLKHTLNSFDLIKAAKVHESLFEHIGMRRSIEPASPNADERFMQMWEAIIEIYSRTAFTYEEDVLPALGALARFFQTKMPGWTYLAGLWKEALPRGLMWTMKNTRGLDARKARRTKPEASQSQGGMAASAPVAPSFTWAALAGRVRYRTAEYARKLEVEVVAAGVDAVGNEVYGDVGTGFVVLRGRVVAFRFPRYFPQDFGNNRGSGDQALGGSIAIHDGWEDGYCSHSEQEVQICKDIMADTWELTSKVESGMETMGRVAGFDTSEEHASYFYPIPAP